MAIETPSRNRYDKFTPEMRDTTVVRLMTTGTSSRDEFANNEISYRNLGIESAEKLHSLLNNRAGKYYAGLRQYYDLLQPRLQPMRDALETRDDLTDEQIDTLSTTIRAIEQRIESLTKLGFVLDDDSIVYRKLKLSSNNATIESSVSSLDNVLASNALDFLNLDALEAEAAARES